MKEATSVRAQSVWESRALDRSAVRAQDLTSTRQLTTAREIINAGREMFKATGSFHFTIKQVSVKAGVALQTVYRHFETKDVLVLAILEEEIQSSVAKIEGAVGAIADPLQKVQAVITAPASRRNSKQQTLMGAAIVREHLRLQVDYPADVALVTAPYFALIAGVLRNAADAGVLHIVDPERDARIIQHLVESFYHQYALGVSAGGQEMTTEYLWDFCRAALDRGSRDTGSTPDRTRKTRRGTAET